MHPQFRSDLKSSREEQQGVVFYRIDDPQTQTSFRLYEIEFLIAKKLDGSRGLLEVIGAVKAEYNFDISEPDLKKFVSQLESMGFIQGEGQAPPAGGPPPPPPDAHVVMGEDTTAPTPADLSAFDSPLLDGEVETDEDLGSADGLVVGEVTSLDADGFDDVEPINDAAEFGQLPTDELTLPPAAGPGGGPPAPPADAYDDTTEQQLASAEDQFAASVDALDEAFTVDDADGAPRRPTASPQELTRMVSTAFEHLKQGYVVHARDYFMAAQESAPDDEDIARMVRHLEAVGDEPDEQTIEGLWQQAVELFPDAAEQVGSERESLDSMGAKPKGGDENLRARVGWMLLLLLVVVGGVTALYYLVQAARLFEGTAQVQVIALESERIPVYFEDGASKVSPMKEQWLTFQGKGKVEKINVKAGARVEPGDIVAQMALKPKVQKKLDAARKAVDKLQAQYDKAADRLGKILEESEGIKVERDQAESKLKELRPKSILKSGGVSKRDLEKYKRVVVKANKKLSKLAKKERKPRQAEKKAKSKVDGARRKLDGLQKKVANKIIRAPYAGVVVEIRAKAGETVTADAKVVLVRDPLASRITFSVDTVGDLQPGGEAYVAVDQAPPTSAKVLAIKDGDGGQALEVKLTDPAGSFAEMEPASFRLVREFVEPAFSVDSNAVVTDPTTGMSAVFLAVQGRAVKRAVEVLESNPNKTMVRPVQGSLRDGDQLVVSYPAEGNVAALLEDAALEIAGP